MPGETRAGNERKGGGISEVTALPGLEKLQKSFCKIVQSLASSFPVQKASTHLNIFFIIFLSKISLSDSQFSVKLMNLPLSVKDSSTESEQNLNPTQKVNIFVPAC